MQFLFPPLLLSSVPGFLLLFYKSLISHAGRPYIYSYGIFPFLVGCQHVYFQLLLPRGFCPRFFWWILDLLCNLLPFQLERVTICLTVFHPLILAQWILEIHWILCQSLICFFVLRKAIFRVYHSLVLCSTTNHRVQLELGKPGGKPIHPGWNGEALPVYSYQEWNSEPSPISGFNAIQFNSGQNSFALNTIEPQTTPSSTYKIIGLRIVPKMWIEEYIRKKRNIQVLGHDRTSRLIGLGLSNCLSDQIRAKVVCCKSLTTLSPDQWLLNHQDSILVPYRSPPMSNRWPHWEGVLPLGRSAVGVFYSPSWQGGAIIDFKI